MCLAPLARAEIAYRVPFTSPLLQERQAMFNVSMPTKQIQLTEDDVFSALVMVFQTRSTCSDKFSLSDGASKL